MENYLIAMVLSIAPSTGIWLIILAGLVIAYSVYFFGEAKVEHRTLRDRLNSIILPSMEFNSVTLNEAAQSLTELAGKYDLAGDGIEFSIETVCGAEVSEEPVLIHLERSPLWDALERVALMYQVTYRIDSESYSITFTKGDEEPEFLEREYALPVDRFPLSWACKDFLAYFRGYGLPFPNGGDMESRVDYDSDNRLLKVTTVENTLNLLEKMFGLDPERTSKKAPK